MKGIEVSNERFTEAVDGYEGWCTRCETFTRDSTESDAEGYDCPVCGENTVMGAEQAAIMGELEVRWER